MTEYIYKLINPRTNLPFYIGRTNDVTRRYMEHCHSLYAKNTLCSQYIATLRFNGITPLIEVIETCETVNEAKIMEVKHINDYYNRYTILNHQTCLIPKEEWEFPKTKQDRVRFCGIGGRRCKDFDKCIYCYTKEKEKRISFIADSLSGNDFVFRTETDNNGWDYIRSNYSFRKAGAFRVPLPNEQHLVISTRRIESRELGITFERITAAEAIDELSADRCLFPKEGRRRRSALGAWKLS